MNISDILTGGVDKIINSVGDAIDKIVTSDEERKILENALEEIKLNTSLKVLEEQSKLDAEITSRWKSDNEHIVTRMVRPATVLWVYFLFTIAILFDGNIGEFHINPAYMPLLETVLVTVTIAFFGSRGVEKVTRSMRKNTLDMF